MCPVQCRMCPVELRVSRMCPMVLFVAGNPSATCFIKGTLKQRIVL